MTSKYLQMKCSILKEDNYLIGIIQELEELKSLEAHYIAKELCDIYEAKLIERYYFLEENVNSRKDTFLKRVLKYIDSYIRNSSKGYELIRKYENKMPSINKYMKRLDGMHIIYAYNESKKLEELFRVALYGDFTDWMKKHE